MLISALNTASKFTQPSAQTFAGQSKLTSNQSEFLKNETSFYPADKFYRQKLMLNAGNNPDEFYKIRSIVGAAEIKSIMSKFNDNDDFYSVGVNDENIAKKLIRANLHIHTDASDGFITVDELLTKAANYSDEVVLAHPSFKDAPFTFAITDHDETASAKKAIEIINDNPLKYRNARTILGIEMTTYNDIAPNIVGEPTNTHILAYGIDPNEKVFNNFIESTKLKKAQIIEKIITQANKTYKGTFSSSNDLFSTQQAKEFFNPLKKNILGIYNYAEKYVQTKFITEEIILKNNTLVEKLKQNNIAPDANNLINMIKENNYLFDHNNSTISAETSISELLSKRLNIEPESIKLIISDGIKSENALKFNLNLKTDLEQFKRTFNPKYDYVPTMETLNEALTNQKGAVIGIAHPLDTVAKIKDPQNQLEFLVDLYTKFKLAFKDKAGFSEAYYQGYNEKLKALKESPQVKNLLNKLSNDLNLFKTGSADSHRLNIFKRYF